MKKMFFYAVMGLFPLGLSAQVQFYSVLPNVPNEPHDEYIEIINTGCQDINLEWYSITDKANDAYVFSGEYILGPHEIVQLPYSETNIRLNNSNEELTLRDGSGDIIDEFWYERSIKGEPIMREGIELSECDDEQEEEEEEYEDWEEEEEHECDASDPDICQSEECDSETGDDCHDGDEEEQEEFVWSGSLQADYLGYQDTDGDGYIDTLILWYTEALTGSVQTGVFLMSSRANGLYSEAISQASGYILDATIQDTEILLSIRPAEIEKTKLVISSSTHSDLRLKTLGDIWATTVHGQPLAPILLTRSFHWYTRIIHPEDEEEEEEEWGSTDTIPFPVYISPILQRPSDATFYNGEFICHKKPCRLNTNFDHIFSGILVASHYSCILETSEQSITACNPPTIEIHNTTPIRFILTHTVSGQSEVYEFPIRFQLTEANRTSVPETRYDELAPKAIIQYDGTMPSDVEWDENIITCPRDTCSLNFTGEESYDPDNSKITFAWFINNEKKSTSRDPGAFRFEKWTHILRLVVTDSSGKEGIQELEIHITGKPTKTTKQSTEPDQSHEETPFIFTPPTLVVQNPKNIRTDDSGSYSCTTNTKTCSINFILEDTVPFVEYHWTLGEHVFISTNPPSRAFGIGTHAMKLEAYNKDTQELLWEQSWTFRVTAAPKSTKATKKATTKKTTTKKATKNTTESTGSISQIMTASGEIRETTDNRVWVHTETITKKTDQSLSYAGISLASVLLGISAYLRFRRKYSATDR